jgi:pimeloyl-ACP methyl ester carboxylesterase
MSEFVFIPGAGGTAWYWHLVVAQLQDAGHRAIAVDLPGDDPAKGLPDYAQLVVDAAPAAPFTLVAQSMGGFTAPLVWPHAPVERVVFVNAMIPNPEERPGEWWDNVGSTAAREAAARAHGYSPEFDLATYFLHDVAPEVAAAGEPYQRPEADRAFGDVCAFDEWPKIPIEVVTGRDDRFFPLELQQRIARERLGIEPTVLPGGHLIALSQPTALSSYLTVDDVSLM